MASSQIDNQCRLIREFLNAPILSMSFEIPSLDGKKSKSTESLSWNDRENIEVSSIQEDHCGLVNKCLTFMSQNGVPKDLYGKIIQIASGENLNIYTYIMDKMVMNQHLLGYFFIFESEKMKDYTIRVMRKDGMDFEYTPQELPDSF